MESVPNNNTLASSSWRYQAGNRWPDQTLSTLHVNHCVPCHRSRLSGPCPLKGRSVGISMPSDSTTRTRTEPVAKTTPSHMEHQLSGEWQYIALMPPQASVLMPGTGSPTWLPKIMDPGKGERSTLSLRASCNCSSSENRWKTADMCMMETW